MSAPPTDTNIQARGVDRMLVRLEHLDKLLNLAGEVIITSSTLHELQRDMTDAVTHSRAMTEGDLQIIKSADETSTRISQDLHDLVMAIRTVEIGETFKLFRRPVRDLARNLKKEIELKFEGEKVLIDKALAERIVEPLLHMLRNAADHGLETPIERIHQGKNEKGIILLRAVEHEGETEIIVSDDGRGINEQKILDKARTSGSNTSADILTILCTPGFSTKERATETSGRGVGLDLVNTMVQEFNGTLTLNNVPKSGCTFHLRIPKLKAVNIIDALIVRCTDTLYALSIDKVVSLQGVRSNEIQASMDRERFIRYLGEPIALFDLSELVGSSSSAQENPELVPVVIIEGKKEKIACVVTEFLAPAKLVNVPLATDMFDRDVTGIAGTCIISGGRVGMTVDIDTLVAMAVGDPIRPSEGHFDASSFSEKPEPASSSDKAEAIQSSVPSTVIVGHTQDELIAKSKLSAQRDRIANRIEESSQKDLSDVDISDLLTELSRGLMELQDALISLEHHQDPELMKEAFRRLHAAKGNFTMLGYTVSATLSHQLETLLDYVRKGSVELSQELMDILLDGVAELNSATKNLPAENTALLVRIDTVMRSLDKTETVTDPDKLLGTTFTLVPVVELQLLGALKQGSQTYETFIRFKPGRQAEFLVACLILRKLCYYGTILATLPSVGDIENGYCGQAIKVLWTSLLKPDELKAAIDKIAPLFGILEHRSIPTTVFRYETSAEI
ncbi:MAG: ATP-binding protein [Planctomycetaceae bacterium]|nr:ATP-binding protein [Planctomycetaceae bacterium]